MVIRACIQFANQEKIINLKQSRTLWKIVARNKIPPQRPRRTSIEQKNNSAIYFYSFTIAFLFSSTFTLLLVSSFAWSGSSSPPVGSNENEQVNVCDVWWLRKVWPISGRVLAETKKKQQLLHRAMRTANHLQYHQLISSSPYQTRAREFYCEVITQQRRAHTKQWANDKRDTVRPNTKILYTQCKNQRRAFDLNYNVLCALFAHRHSSFAFEHALHVFSSVFFFSFYSVLL